MLDIDVKDKQDSSLYLDDLDRKELLAGLEVYISEKTLGKLLDVSPVFISRNWERWAKEYGIEPINLSGTKARRRYLRWKASDVKKLFGCLKAECV